MPLYEYQCLTCGKKTELLQAMSDPPLAVCPECGGEVKKLISSPAFQFKGTGWYVTDYAGKKGTGASESGGSDAKSDKPAASSEKSGDKPAESKPSTPAPAAASKTSSD